jgi:hypothetical protein
MRRFVTYAAVSLAGCIQIGDAGQDAGEASPATQLHGTWSYPDTNGSCLYAVIFGGETDDAFEEDTLCGLSDGSRGVMSRVGTYTIRGDGELVITVTRSTCAGDMADSKNVNYALDSNGLHFAAQGGETTYQRNPGSLNGGNTRFGCFSADGSFTPGMLETL